MLEVKEAIASSLGRGLTDDQVAKITDLAKTKDFMGGDEIVRQFDRSSDLIIILNGSAKIKTFNGELIREVSTGSILGEISLVDSQPRSATVHSAHGTKVAIIPGEELKSLMQEDSALAAGILRNICETLCTRLRVATIHLDGLMAR